MSKVYAVGGDIGCTHFRFSLGEVGTEKTEHERVFDIRSEFSDSVTSAEVYKRFLGGLPTEYSNNIASLALRAAGPVTDNSTLVDLRNIGMVINIKEAAESFGVDEEYATLGNDIEAIVADLLFADHTRYLPIPWAKSLPKGQDDFPLWHFNNFHIVAHGTGMGTLDTSIRRNPDESVHVTYRRSERQHSQMSALSDEMHELIGHLGKVQRIEAKVFPKMTDEKGIAGVSWEWAAAGGGLGGVVRLFLAENLRTGKMDEDQVEKFMRGDFSCIRHKNFRESLKRAYEADGEHLSAVITEFAGIFKQKLNGEEVSSRVIRKYNKNKSRIKECVAANEHLMEIWGGYAGNESLERPVAMAGGCLRYYHRQIGAQDGKFRESFLNRSSGRNDFAVTQVPLLRTKIGGNTGNGALLIAKSQFDPGHHSWATFSVDLNDSESNVVADPTSLNRKLKS